MAEGLGRSQFKSADVVIVGGGIAGVTCAEYVSHTNPHLSVLIIAATDILKTAVTTRKVTEFVEELEVREKDANEFQSRFPNVGVLIGFVNMIDGDNRVVETLNGHKIRYKKLCICSGAAPLSLPGKNGNVITIRDTDTVRIFQEKLSNAKRVMIVGNGGIALELVYEITGCQVIWVVKHKSIGNKFFDEGASSFLLPSLSKTMDTEKSDRKVDQAIFRRKKYAVDREKLNPEHSNLVKGTALGPDWSSSQTLLGVNDAADTRNCIIEYGCECVSALTPDEMKQSGKKVTKIQGEETDTDWPVYVELTNGMVYGADLVVSAIGVEPCRSFNIKGSSLLKLSKEGFIDVDDNMRTNIPDVYAAGDCCNASWEQADHWFQMQLWTQGWQMGAFAGKCIAEHFRNNNLPLDFCFELFTHATTFFGYKVCLLGLFNAQGLSGDFEYLVRCTRNEEYIKLVIHNGRVQGAVLIGETDMEETIENLILNQMDISNIGASLLDPDIDIDDYFD